MRSQTLIIVALALTFGGIAAVGVLLFSNNHPSQGSGRATMVLAAADVPRGETLTAASLVVKECAADAVLSGVITKIEDALDRSTLTPLYKGEPILEAKLAAKGAGRGLASLIKKGMRAVTIPTPTVGAGVAGFIVPGSRVDIHWISNEPRSRDDHSAGHNAPPLLENVEVLAVDDKIDVPAANRTEGAQMKSVTVQVDPVEAGKLTPALSKGTIHLSLRNPGDEGRAPPRPPEVVPAPQEADHSLATLIKEGMRAISIPTPNVASHVTGFIVPGDRVDVHWTPSRASDESRLPVSVMPLLEDVEILAVQENREANREAKADVQLGLGKIETVTIQVTPEEAGKLGPAMSNGTIYLSLRKLGDEGRVPSPVIAAVPEPPPRPRVIRVFKGARVTSHQLDRSAKLFSNAK